eukprot:Gb_38422 [translate_table: standard]
MKSYPEIHLHPARMALSFVESTAELEDIDSHEVLAGVQVAMAVDQTVLTWTATPRVTSSSRLSTPCQQGNFSSWLATLVLRWRLVSFHNVFFGKDAPLGRCLLVYRPHSFLTGRQVQPRKFRIGRIWRGTRAGFGAFECVCFVENKLSSIILFVLPPGPRYGHRVVGGGK